MKKLLLATAAVLAFASTAYAQSRQDFVLVNRTGYDISELYISPGNANSWQEDVLDEDGLEDGDTQTIRFTGDTKICLWDLKVVYEEDDSSAVWHDIDLCKVSKITIRYDRKSDTTSATFD